MAPLLWEIAAGVAIIGGAYFYVHHKGEADGAVKCEAAKVEGLTAQIAAQNTFVAAAENLKVKQVKEVGDVRKEVDEAYVAGCVPERVRKFYIDTPPPACGANVSR